MNETLLREHRGAGRGAPRSTYPRDGGLPLVVPSATMPAIAKSTATGGFLSRMWAATKGQATAAEKESLLAAEEGGASGPSSAFRRLAHSKSTAALFRSQQQQQVDV